MNQPKDLVKSINDNELRVFFSNSTLKKVSEWKKIMFNTSKNTNQGTTKHYTESARSIYMEDNI